VSVSVWDELGSVEMLIGELLQLGEDSVVRLDRSVGDRVDLMSQGVKLAHGEVIVVEDCFAFQIQENLLESRNWRRCHNCEPGSVTFCER